jgi:hypothetical protein
MRKDQKLLIKKLAMTNRCSFMSWLRKYLVSIFKLIRNFEKTLILSFADFENIYKTLIINVYVFDRKTFAKSLKYRVNSKSSILWRNHQEIYLSCISEFMIFSILRHVHDHDEHFQKERILAKLRDQIYWSSLFSDVKKYIRECLKCARHDSAQKSQLLHSVRVKRSFQLLEFDFIDSLSLIDFEDFYIFHVMNYFFKFFITFLYSTANAFDVISTFQKMFILYATLSAIYCDREQHFNNIEVTSFLDKYEISYSFNFFEFSQSTEMIEIENRLLKDILKKSRSQENWKTVLNQFTRNLNNRTIRHLRIFSSMILLKISSDVDIVDSVFQVSIETVIVWNNQLINHFTHLNSIERFLENRKRIQNLILKRSNQRKNDKARKHDKKIREHQFSINDLILIYQKNIEKLKSRWRDSFKN